MDGTPLWPSAALRGLNPGIGLFLDPICLHASLLSDYLCFLIDGIGTGFQALSREATRLHRLIIESVCLLLEPISLDVRLVHYTAPRCCASLRNLAACCCSGVR